MGTRIDPGALGLVEDVAGQWHFYAPTEGNRVADQYPEVRSFVAEVLDALSDLYVPDAAEFANVVFGGDLDLQTAAQFDEAPVTITGETVSDPAGLSPGTVADRLGDHYRRTADEYDDAAVFVDEIRFSTGVVAVATHSGDGYVTGDPVEDPGVEVRGHLQGADLADLLSVTYGCRPGVLGHDRALHSVGITTRSRVWFRDDDVGVANRERLRRVLGTVRDAWEFGEVDESSDRYDLSAFDLAFEA